MGKGRARRASERAEADRIAEREYLSPPPKLSDDALKRLRELAGHHVPVAEIAAVLRCEFKVKIKLEDLDEFYRDEILIGRAYAAERISKRTMACAEEGSATAQKTLFDRAREAGQREEEMGGGRQLRQIKLVVVGGKATRMKSEPLNGNRDTTKMRAALAEKRAAKKELERDAAPPEDPGVGTGAPQPQGGNPWLVGSDDEVPCPVQRRLGRPRKREESFLRHYVASGTHSGSEQLDGVRPGSPEVSEPVGEEAA